MRRFGLLAAVVTLAAGRLAAQHAGQVEVGAFGSYTRYDATFGLAHKIGGGVRMGYLLGSIVGVEADVLFQPEYTVTPPGGTTSTLEPLIGSASLVINAVHANRLMVYVLGGYSLLDVGTRAPYRFTDNGVHGGAGVRVFLTDRIALRVEGRAIYSPSTQSTFGPTTATHFLGTAGLSVFHLGAPSKDSDHDGVPDNKDACPDTPAGAAVDSKGCPIDSDRDGVPDGIDKCPGTPAGAHVDATGCPVDSDADGVPDGIDQCPGTPAGAHVDAKGCPVDSDGDGVPDGVDQCPNTPPGVAVDAAGCPLDSDKDGVPDGIDKCPNTPAGATVDASGCPLDTDLDGVPDGIDQCPNTPAGTKVDAVGCPLPVEAVKPTATPTPPGKCPPAPPGSQVDANGCLILFAPEAARSPTPGAPPRPTLVLTGVNFETGRSILTRDSYMVLDAVAASLVANPDIRIEVAGYTDSTGRKFTNLRLSQARAVALRFYQALASASDRMRYRELGHSTLGAPMIALVISSPQNLRALDRYRELNAKLADPRGFKTAKEAEDVLRGGKTIVLITSGIHSTEVGGHLSPAVLAYRLASDTSLATRAILDNVILWLVPSLNPDGVSIVTRWYNRTLGTTAEGTDPPELYHHYAGHDNNREWYASSQAETALVGDSIHNVWHPQIVHDIHQQDTDGSRLFLPPYLDPIEPNVDPLLVDGVNALGTAMAWALA